MSLNVNSGSFKKKKKNFLWKILEVEMVLTGTAGSSALNVERFSLTSLLLRHPCTCVISSEPALNTNCLQGRHVAEDCIFVFVLFFKKLSVHPDDFSVRVVVWLKVARVCSCSPKS